VHTGPRQRVRRATYGRIRPRKPAQPELAPVLAMLGTLLAWVALPIKAAGLYRVSRALDRMQIEEPDDHVNRLLLAAAGHPLAVAHGMLLAGGAMIIYAFRWGGYRERWFLWSTLALGLFYIWQPFFGTVFGIVWLCSVALAWKRTKPLTIREVTVIPE